MGHQDQDTPDEAGGPENRSHRWAAACLACFAGAGLFAGSSQILISHDGKVYHLRTTRNRKLILTKQVQRQGENTRFGMLNRCMATNSPC